MLAGLVRGYEEGAAAAAGQAFLAAEAAASGRPPVTLARHIWPAMTEAVAHVFRAAGKRLNPRGLDYCFELLVRYAPP